LNETTSTGGCKGGWGPETKVPSLYVDVSYLTGNFNLWPVHGASYTHTQTLPCQLVEKEELVEGCLADFPDSKCLVEQGLRTPVAGEAGFVPVQVLTM